MLPAGSIQWFQLFHHDLLHPGGVDGGDSCVSWDTSKAPGCYREMDTSNQTWRAAGKSRTKWRFSYFSSLRTHQQCWDFPNLTVMSHDVHDDQRRDLIKQASLAPDILQWAKYVFNKWFWTISLAITPPLSLFPSFSLSLYKLFDRQRLTGMAAIATLRCLTNSSI